MPAIFNLELDTSYYNILVINDAMRMLIIQLVVQILFTLRNSNIECFSEIFIENTLFIILGVLVYWLVFKNIVNFTSTQTEDEHIHYQNIYKSI